ncbi:helix-turn-helix transcriptional regulator [Pseudomonas sp. CBSPBW29]|uniref:helix-turn-helix transcriptional regulator n=1 Tax=Pseudomonas sp. CBS TaxID=2971912 RepID=UPI0021ABFD01|nr:helix-turn-helix transcriptional regulator [Pseudomonas sp. CBS]WEL43643.1 helix-turn-helix transcriptional regulator [Pseudomonas sp. CBSPBW29]WEL68177.1 helix-turn-helix transcriptional regulator [Pseudomonas sp. CBSPCGW29]WEL75198.1 helix-turn-helix transcriptional regulator [Pseudomonas sp. CBSPAW29]WEL80558.1 helix-turn-helix transcriptional regulator [Pseudomonas sp. CBSPCAW29]WEL89072.1 helix-turn-helix transcriptional regulator [Pseudomonas sp. CBSPCBW29]
MSPPIPIQTYDMQQRSDRPDFYIRDKSGRAALTSPHKHDYFQIQINLGGDTVQHIGGSVRLFPKRALAFILPHRLHMIPHPENGEFMLLNFAQHFLLPQLQCDPLDLEDVPIAQAPELTPFRFQEHLDFILDEGAFEQLTQWLSDMRALDAQRGFGARERLKGYLLNIIGLVCQSHALALQALAADDAAGKGRADALGRVRNYIRQHEHRPTLTLKEAAAEAFLSPNYLTHLLKKETGKTFSQLVLDRRMQLARSLLLAQHSTIGQVALACGFVDEAYFSRRFRKMHGMAPGQYRRTVIAAGMSV